MAEKGQNGFSPPPAAALAGPPNARRRSPLPLIILAALFIIVPFLAWYGTWFGRELSDDEIGKYLVDEEHPRKVQHALSQIAERMDKRDERARQWYPRLLQLAESPVAEFRLTVAWLMGKDNRSEEFHAALLRLLQDREPIVRRNAALSLVLFGDTSGRGEIRAILQPYTVTSPAEGTIASLLPAGSQIAVGSLLARLKLADGRVQEVRSPLPGRIQQVLLREGAQAKTGDPLLALVPDSNSVWEALRALYLIGQKDDVPEVERYSRGVEGMSEDVKRQAVQTLREIQRRADSSGNSDSSSRPEWAASPAG